MQNLPAVLPGLGDWSALVSSEFVAHFPILKLDMSPQQKQINPSWTHSRKNSLKAARNQVCRSGIRNQRIQEASQCSDRASLWKDTVP